jgi:hypothetical protein
MEPYQVITIVVAAFGVLIAGGGLVVSIISLRRSSANEAQSRRLQEKQEELAELQLKLHRDEVEKMEQSSTSSASNRRADVRVSLEGSAKRARFVIRNWGYAAAKDINFDVTPVEGRSSPLVNGDADVKLPIPRLAPGGDCSLIAALSFDTGVAFDVSWTWTEEDGSQRQQSSRVSL